MTLSSTTAAAGTTASLNLSLSSPSGSEPAALEWTLAYPAASIANFSVSAGAALSAAGKSLSCDAGATGYTCIAYGLNSNTIGNGVVAILTATLTTSAITAPVSVPSAQGASVSGTSLTVAPTGGVITIAAPTNGNTPTTPTSGPAGFSTIRVNAGGPNYSDPSGNLWMGDTAYVGGYAAASTAAISATATPALYQDGRWGTFSYQFAVPNGSYTVILKFAEIYFTTAGSRLFNVNINGTAVLTNFDIVAQAGGPLKAIDESFPVTVSNGQLSIQFSVGGADQPLVNAIEIDAGSTSTTAPPPTTTPTPPASAAVVRLNSGGSAYTDASGNFWNGDYDYSGGNTAQTSASISGTTTPALYQDGRWGTFSYQFAVPNGSYTVILKFAEIYFTTAGSRLFNVNINGTAVLTNFDIVAQAGGPLKAIDESFPVTVSNGQLSIQFSVGGADQPLVNAIEIDAGTATTAASSRTTPSTSTVVFRANSGGEPYTDASGNFWNGDYDYAGGNTAETSASISGTTTPILYQTCRWGSFQYTIAVPNGNY
ncbi:MAG TPA: malectin domain-containing carbohydrate-binding protein, partial [Bryobacteraceae bacterium]|nr:malectin domain-containing carbohydrate-binding protein [Bryobacteraceae bacterium]